MNTLVAESIFDSVAESVLLWLLANWISEWITVTDKHNAMATIRAAVPFSETFGRGVSLACFSAIFFSGRNKLPRDCAFKESRVGNEGRLECLRTCSNAKLSALEVVARLPELSLAQEVEICACCCVLKGKKMVVAPRQSSEVSY